MKNRLLKGEIIEIETEQKDFTIEHSKSLGGSMKFKIWDGIRFIHMSKTFKSLEKKMNELNLLDKI